MVIPIQQLCTATDYTFSGVAPHDRKIHINKQNSTYSDLRSVLVPRRGPPCPSRRRGRSGRCGGLPLWRHHRRRPSGGCRSLLSLRRRPSGGCRSLLPRRRPRRLGRTRLPLLLHDQLVLLLRGDAVELVAELPRAPLLGGGDDSSEGLVLLLPLRLVGPVRVHVVVDERPLRRRHLLRLVLGAERGQRGGHVASRAGLGLGPGVAARAAAELVDGALDAALQAEALHAEAAHGPVRLARPVEERVGDGRRRVHAVAREEAWPRQAAAVEPAGSQRRHHGDLSLLCDADLGRSAPLWIAGTASVARCAGWGRGIVAGVYRRTGRRGSVAGKDRRVWRQENGGKRLARVDNTWREG
uniref:Uncharacterized protein n=1 Tax=Zea mays TaxID=4577 RepID=A0A804R415_MAIZE